MFVDRLLENNPQLIQASLSLYKQGIIAPNTYVLDYDAILENAKHMLEIAKQNDVKLFYMLKQIGRNPIIAKALDEIGFDGCVAVDFDEYGSPACDKMAFDDFRDVLESLDHFLVFVVLGK